MNAATLRNMTLEELTQYVDQCDSVPRDVVLEIIACFNDDLANASEERDELNDTLNSAIDEIRDIVSHPLDTATLYQDALQIWIEDWSNEDE